MPCHSLHQSNFPASPSLPLTALLSVLFAYLLSSFYLLLSLSPIQLHYLASYSHWFSSLAKERNVNFVRLINLKTVGQRLKYTYDSHFPSNGLHGQLSQQVENPNLDCLVVFHYLLYLDCHLYLIKLVFKRIKLQGGGTEWIEI